MNDLAVTTGMTDLYIFRKWTTSAVAWSEVSLLLGSHHLVVIEFLLHSVGIAEGGFKAHVTPKNGDIVLHHSPFLAKGFFYVDSKHLVFWAPSTLFPRKVSNHNHKLFISYNSLCKWLTKWWALRRSLYKMTIIGRPRNMFGLYKMTLTKMTLQNALIPSFGISLHNAGGGLYFSASTSNQDFQKVWFIVYSRAKWTLPITNL